MLSFLASQCIETLGKGYVNELFYQELAKVLHEVLDEHRKRQEERIGTFSYMVNLTLRAVPSDFQTI